MRHTVFLLATAALLLASLFVQTGAGSAQGVTGSLQASTVNLGTVPKGLVYHGRGDGVSSASSGCGAR